MSRDSTTSVTHLTTEKLTAGLDEVHRSPKEDGVLEMIVSRPGVNEREVLEEAELNAEVGLVGDSWSARGTATWNPHPSMQIAIMNSRAAALVAQNKDRWPLAGDQLYIPRTCRPGHNLRSGLRPWRLRTSRTSHALNSSSDSGRLRRISSGLQLAEN